MASRTARPRFIKPMAATLVATLPAGDDWLYEAKFDGYRALALKDGSSVRLLSRKENELTTNYPGVAAVIARLPAKQILLDGEIVAFDPDGRPSFQQLQHRASKATTIRYFAFDLLHLNGKDFLKEPLQRRKEQLKMLLTRSLIEFSDSLPGTPDQVIKAVTQVGLEGVMAKRRDSFYEPGVRSRAWLKLKLQHQQEFVIAGFKPENDNFQSIVVGYYEGTQLRFAGRVNAGFTPAQRVALFERVKPFATSDCPFVDLPTGKTSHWGEGVTEDDMKKLKWVKPQLVAEVAFTEWTRDGHLRHSSFVGLRDDKCARQVVREKPNE